MKYHLTVNEKNHDVEYQGKDLLIDGEMFPHNIESKSASDYVVTVGGSPIKVKVLDTTSNQCVLFIGGRAHTISQVDRLSSYKEIVGFESEDASVENEISAPMPGKIIELLVEEGQEINKGDGLIILEAMKMENVIKAPISGKVVEVLAKVGDLVQKNDVIIKF